jgi:hypothetical protein
MRLPELKIPWWDVEAGQWRIASLPERTLSVVSSGEPAVADPAPQVVAEPQQSTGAVTVYSGFWRLVAEILAVAWLLTLIAWWWSARPRREHEPSEPAPPPLHKQQARSLKAARRAALEGDGAGVRQALLEWGRLQWPTDAPRSIGVLARRVSAPLSDELVQLSAAAYGSNGSGWDGEALARYLRSFAILDDSANTTSVDPLPPLMPQT